LCVYVSVFVYAHALVLPSQEDLLMSKYVWL